MALRTTRNGRVFSPYDTIPSAVDALSLVAAAFGDEQQGVDNWELEPLSPLSSPTPSPSPTVSSLPDLPVTPPLEPLSVPLLAEGYRPLSGAPFRNAAAFGDVATVRAHAAAPSLPGRTSPVLAGNILQPAARSPDATPDSRNAVEAGGQLAVARDGPAPPPGPCTHSRNGKRKRRAKKRAAAKDEPLGKKSKSSSSKRAAEAALLEGQLRVESLPIAHGAFEGKRDQDGKEPCGTLEELRDQGYEYFDWDGRTTFKILDKDRRVIGLLAGQPSDPSWEDVTSQAYAAMKQASERCTFDTKHKDHRRGAFATLATGVSFGGGRKSPGKIHNSARNQKALDDLCEDPAIKRLAGFGSAMLSTYAPDIFENTRNKLSNLQKKHPSLRFNFNNSVYPAASYNFGPATVCLSHTDAANDPCNWCHIVALGRYDCSRGGHIVFPDLKLVVRFPPGASILIPSAILRHGNTPIAPEEERMSFTQYCAGGLLRWVECGFRTVLSLERDDPVEYRRYLASLVGRAEQCCGLFEVEAIRSVECPGL